MTVVFFTGNIRMRSGDSCLAAWASTPFGYRVLVADDGQVRMLDSLHILTQDLVTELELPGVDRAGLETLVSHILTGSYLNRSGVKGKGDAVLFLLVNEAIHSLGEIARKEGL
jgi:hypothetical protein